MDGIALARNSAIPRFVFDGETSKRATHGVDKVYVFFLLCNKCKVLYEPICSLEYPGILLPQKSEILAIIIGDLFVFDGVVAPIPFTLPHPMR